MLAGIHPEKQLQGAASRTVKGGHMVRIWHLAIGAALAGLFTGCATAPKVSSPSDITLTKAVHFQSSEGVDLIVPAGTYQVGAAGTGQLRLVPQTGGAALVVQAQDSKYDEPLTDLLALSIPYKEDEHHVVLLKPDGTALDATGTYSGVKTRVVASLVPLSRPLIQQYRFPSQQVGSGGSSSSPPPPPNTNPDLVITNMVLTPASPTPYDLAMLQLTVKNQGLTDAKLDALNATQLNQGLRHLTVQLWDAAGKPVKGWSIEPSNLPVTITAGTSQVLNVPEVTRLTDTVGTYRWDITVNSFLTEANAANNTYSATVTVQPRPAVVGPAPDLALSACSFTPTNPTWRDFIQVSTQYSNQGPVAANFPYTAPLLQWTSSPAIAGRSSFRWGAGNQVASGTVQSFQSQLNIGQVAPGTYQITLTIDPDNRVGESNKGNNVVSCALVVGP
jgi:CARDB